MASAIETVAGKLKRAADLGRRLRAIRDEPALWTLSRAAWRSKCLELAGWSLEQLEAARVRLEAIPVLAREAEITATVWERSGQDQPALASYFGDGLADRDAAVYAALLHSRLSHAEISALISWRCAELRPDGTFGRADSLDDGAKALQPHVAALAELDAELVTLVRVGDLSWRDGRPVLRTGAIEIAISEATVARIATTIAEHAQLQARLPAAA